MAMATARINPMRASLLFLSVSIVCASAGSAFAQRSNATATFESNPRQTSDQVEDLGVIEEAGGAGKDGKSAPPPQEESRTKYRANVSARADFTTNAKLSGDHSSGDLLFFPGLELGLNRDLGRGFAFDIAGKVESALYTKFDERAFIGYSVPATLEWRPRPNLPRSYVGTEAYRFDSFDTGDLVTQALGVSVGTDYGISFNGGSSLAFIGYNFTHYFSDPSADNRGVHRAVIGVAHQFKPQLTGQMFYAYEFGDFEDVDRHDSRHVVAASLIYQFNRHLFGNVAGTFIDNDSTQNRASYQAAVASLGLTWQF
jgi:hypothetical protein